MPPRRLRAPAQGRRSCRDRPVEGSSVEEPSASIVDPPPTRPASASLTDAAGPSNPHRRQTARPTPAGSLYGPWLSSTYVTAGPTSFRVSWFDLEARFFVPTHISNGGARRGRQDRPSLTGRIFTASSTLACWLVVAMTLSRGARRSRRDVRRTTTLYSVGQETRTMMQSCASVAKLRSGGPILPFGIAAIEHPPDARHLEPSSAPCFHARRIREQSQALLLMTPGEGQGRRERRLLGRDATAQ